MNDTPTPRTDAESCHNKTFDSPMGAIQYSRTLERELTAAQEEIEMLNIRYGAAAMHHDNNMGEVMQQRDEARRLAERYRNLSCDSQEEADETILPWETTNPNEL
jgi:hypothetical protein